MGGMDIQVANVPFNTRLHPDYQNIAIQKCRLCLASFDTVIELFSDEAIQMNIKEKLREFCHLEIGDDDTAPRTICFTCLNEVNRFCDFYRRVQDNQKLLALAYKRSHVETSMKNDGELEVVETDDIVSRSLASSGLRDILVAIENEVEVVTEPEDGNEEVLVIHEDSESIENECEDATYEYVSSPHETQENRDEPPSDDKESLTKEIDNDLSDQDTLTEGEENSIEIIENDSNVTLKRRTRHRIALDRPIREFFVLQCKKCGINFQTFQCIKNHMSRIHNEEFYFLCCNRKLCRRDVILEHIDTHLNPKKFTCEICNQFCKTKITLKMHLKQHIPKDQQPFACEKCGYRFALKSQLKSHMNTHLSDEEKKYVCDECGKAFAFKFVLEKHKKRMHVRQKNYMCEICARSFVDKVNLTEHKRVHDTSLPRLECHQCNALLKTKKTLKIHMRLHDLSQFPCKLCSKVFPTKTGLLNHVRYYHTDRQYPCTTCGRVFKMALNLKEHMATHTGESLYNCEYCDKTFNAKANRYVHIKKVHPVEWADKQKLRWRVENEKYSE